MPSKARWEKLSPEEKQQYKDATKKHQQENREYWRELNHRAYVKKVGVLKNVLDRSEEDRAERARMKSNLRCTRAKLARFDDELTELVVLEAHDLRKRRNDITGFEWHVDHIVPLVNKFVSGLHIWSNLQVIPKVLNLIKGNRLSHT